MSETCPKCGASTYATPALRLIHERVHEATPLSWGLSSLPFMLFTDVAALMEEFAAAQSAELTALRERCERAERATRDAMEKVLDRWAAFTTNQLNALVDELWEAIAAIDTPAETAEEETHD